MKIVLSPAKSLNFELKLPAAQFTKNIFLNESRIINSEIKKLQPAELSNLMNISDTLAQLNWVRNNVWKTPFTAENARPAIYAFDGDVYTGLDVFSLPVNKIEMLQNKVRILSGLYGLLKPLDLMQAYRLEMGIKISIGESKNLYDFWKTKITASLNKELKKDELFVNLASKEYFSAIDNKQLKVPVITPEFKDLKNGKLKIISFFAKRARGLMVRYIIDHNIETIEGLKDFDSDGYRFDDNLSDGNNLVFVR